MTFRAIRLPERYALGAQGGPVFSTVIAAQESGDESREGTVDQGLGRWTVGYEGKNEDVANEFRDFFSIVNGRLDTWMFWDALDYTCAADESYLDPADDDSPPSIWQMCKARTFGGLTYLQKIILPRAGTITVNGGGSYTVDSTTGLLTRNSGANPTTFVCEFDKLCRFDADALVQTIQDKTGAVSRGGYIASYSGIPIVEVPLTSA